MCLALLCLVLTGWALDARVYSPSYLVSNYAGYPGQGTTDGAGLAQAQFAYPQGVAVDAVGNRYLADTANNTVRRITPSGVVTTLAGKAGTADFRNGRAGEAWFNRPAGIAVSADGTIIYVADTGNHLLRRITTASGEVVTVVGAAQLAGGAEGDETTARLNAPTGLALATDGTLYVADTGNHRIRKIVFGSGSAVTVTTLAGNSTPPADSVNGTGTAAKFNQPVALAINSAQTELYVAEVASHVVRRITLSTSSVITLAGLEGLAGSTGGTGTSARFNKPSGLAFNPEGTELFVADQGSHLLRKIVIAGGTVSTVAGTNLTEGSASGAALITARFRQPSGLAYDAVAGGVVVADTANSQLRLYDPVAATVTTLAGAPESKNSTDGSAATARFNTPAAVALHTDGTLYVADRGNHVIRRITAGGVVSTVAGAAGAAGTVDGAAGTARFNQPSALALNAAGTELFVADAGTTGVITSGRVRRIVLGPGEVTVSTLSGTFNDPRGLALTTAGVLYVSETGAGRIWTYATTGSAPTLWVSSGLNRPWGLVAEPSGAIFVADSYNNSVKKLTPGTPVTVTTLAGTGTSVNGANDGAGTAATFYYPYGLARDNDGNIYVAELENDLVRRISPAGVVTTLAGSPQAAGYADGAEGATRLRNPLGLAVTGDGGTIYVADGDNQTVRKLSTLPAPSFTGASTANGTYGQAFSYSVQAAPAITAYALTGSLPAGLSFDSARGQITGVPTVSGVYNTTLSAANSAGTTAFSLTITLAKQTVTITLDGLNPRWDGTNRVPTAVTSNGTYTVAFTYNGSPTPPTKVGTYTVVATVDEPNFTGTATGTLTVLPPEVYTVGALPGGADVIAEGLAVDGAGNVYSADTAANLIRKLTPEGVLTDIVVVDDPTGVAVTSDGTLYITTTTVTDGISTGYIKRFNPAVGVVEPFASGFTATGALVLSRDGTKLFFSDSDTNGAYVRQIALADATVTTLATWLEGFPTGIAEAPDGTLYVTDLVKNHINKLSLGMGGVSVELFAGSATDLEGSLDGTGANAFFDSPYGLVYSTDAALLVSDYGNNTLRRVSVPTAIVSTVAG